jgi:uncharacterized protein YjiS (DUF1127 family)
MILNLEANGTVSMAGARGMRVEVLEGLVWVTRKGRSEDLILRRGARYSVEDDGVVLVGLEKRARLGLNAGKRPSLWMCLRRLAGRWAEAAELRAAVRQLEELPDHRLRDLGLIRDQIATVVYNRFSR